MAKKKTIAFLAGGTALAAGITAHVLRKKAEKTTYKAELIEPVQPRKMGFYEKYVKRGLDVACASAAIICFSPLYIGVALLVKFKLGSPVIFTQDRPGLVDKDGRETVFKMYKFRTMTDERDENGELLPDDVRLTKFGAWLRKTSLDELAEVFNILNGTMSVIGPRPQLVRDMTFMTKEQRMRHTAKPGLSGLAQVNGRNAITWEDKLEWDKKYIRKVGFKEDVRIILETVKKAFIKQEGISQDNMATAEDFGDYLLKNKKITSEEYDKKQIEAKQILNKNDGILREEDLGILSKYDYIIHCASNADPKSYAIQPVETILTNILGNKNVLEYCKEYKKCRMLLTSTFEVYGEISNTSVYKENMSGIIDQTVLRNAYPESKRSCELLLRSYVDEYNINAVICRLPSVYGPTMLKSDSKAHGQFIKNALNKENIVLKSKGEQRRTYSYVVDVVSGIFKVLFNGLNGEVYNIANENSIASIAEVASICAEIAGTNVVFDLPDKIEKKGFSQSKDCILDNSKLKSLGWNGKYTLKQGLVETIESLREDE